MDTGTTSDHKQERELWLILVGVLLGSPKLATEVYGVLQVGDADKFDDIGGILHGLHKADRKKVAGFLERFGAVFTTEGSPAYMAVVEGLRERLLKRHVLLAGNRLANSARAGTVAQFIADMEKELVQLRERA